MCMYKNFHVWYENACVKCAMQPIVHMRWQHKNEFKKNKHTAQPETCELFDLGYQLYRAGRSQQ